MASIRILSVTELENDQSYATVEVTNGAEVFNIDVPFNDNSTVQQLKQYIRKTLDAISAKRNIADVLRAQIGNVIDI